MNIIRNYEKEGKTLQELIEILLQIYVKNEIYYKNK